MIKKLFAVLATLMMFFTVFSCSSGREYSVRITVPAGSTAKFVYSDEEISPIKNTFTVMCGEGVGDTEVILLPVEVKEENAYDMPEYITPGLTVRLEAEKSAWFKIGINMQNPTDEDITVYLEVSGVDIRIP